MDRVFVVYFVACNWKLGYYQALCAKRFNTRHSAEFYAEEIKRGTTVAVCDEHGKWIDTKDIIRVEVLEQTHRLFY